MAFDKGQSFSLFTGLIPFEVVAINPTLRELHELGYTHLTKDPLYTKMSKDLNTGVEVKQGVVMFYLESLPFHIEVNGIKELIEAKACKLQQSYYINDEIRKSQTGKTQFLNARGMTRYAENSAAIEFNKVFTEKGLREAYKGEVG
jgi:hypothetical protein